jgi:hypothetical protein
LSKNIKLTNLVSGSPHLCQEEKFVAPLLVDCQVELIAGGVVDASDGSVARQFDKSTSDISNAASVLTDEQSERR